jgi:hypothetical protein
MYTSLHTLIGAHRQISLVSTLSWLHGSVFKNVFTFSFLSCVFTAHSPLKKGKKKHIPGEGWFFPKFLCLPLEAGRPFSFPIGPFPLQCPAWLVDCVGISQLRAQEERAEPAGHADEGCQEDGRPAARQPELTASIKKLSASESNE